VAFVQATSQSAMLQQVRAENQRNVNTYTCPRPC
jgi:hypothetical protein